MNTVQTAIVIEVLEHVMWVQAYCHESGAWYRKCSSCGGWDPTDTGLSENGHAEDCRLNNFLALLTDPENQPHQWSGHRLRTHSPEEPVEHWREHPTEPGLYMSSNGRGMRGGEEVYQTENEKGYLRITCSDGTPRGVGVLVLETFVGPRPDGHDCDHVNRDRQDNRLTNLRWLPVEENRAVRGRRNSAAKLTPTDVREIRQRYEGPESQYDLAAAFGVDQRTISMIVRGETWTHVKPPIGQALDGEGES